MRQSKKQKAWKDNHYQLNKEFYKQRLRDRRNEYKKWIWEYKSNHPCELCGQSHPAALDFHHMNPKEKSRQISQMTNAGFNKDKILLEISKCQVLCATCHRIIEWEMRQERDDNIDV